MATASSQVAPGKRRRWLRRYRWLLWLPVLVVLGSVVYFNQVGLPAFLKAPLLRQLRAGGWEVQFDRLRLDWSKGIVAEQVALTETRKTAGPTIQFGEVILEPDWAELTRLRFHLRLLQLHDGVLALPLSPAEPQLPPVRIDTVQAELRFLPGDRWELARLTAEGSGIRLRVTGLLTNASAVRGWARDAVPAGPTPTPAIWQSLLRRAMAYTRQWKFGRPPVLNVFIGGDARDPAGMRAELSLEAEAIESRWGTLESLSVRSELNRASRVPGLGLSEAIISFRGARTAWGMIQAGQWEVQWMQAFTNLLPAKLEWRLNLDRLQSPWGETPRAQVELHAFPDPQFPGQLVGEMSATSDAILGGLARAETNQLTAKVWLDPVTYLPTRADYQYTAANARFENGSARALELLGRMRVLETESRVAVDDSWAWWGALAPIELNWDGQIDGLELRGVPFETIKFAADWSAPEFQLKHLRLKQQGGSLEAAGSVDVGTRQTEASATMNLDVRALEPLLTPKTVQWLSQYGWARPPQAEASVRLILPEWTNARPDWRSEVLPTLRLEGHVEAGPASFRGLQADAVDLRFTYTNRVWHLPELVATRPEGKLEFSYTEDTTTRDYHFHGRSRIDPQALRPLFDSKAHKAFDLFQFATPPLVTGDVRGRWRARERTDIRAQLEATRFTFRGEPIDELSAALRFTNLFLSATEVQLRTGEESVIAPGVGFRLEDQVLFLTNATARADPLRVGRAIGPKTARILSPYQFLKPPWARVNGSVNVRQTRIANLQFEVAGGPFHYWRFRLPEIAATVGWTNNAVTIDQLRASFYQGKLDGRFRVDISPGETTPFQFEARAARADFHELLSDVNSPTNQVEGDLSVDLAITYADARDWQSWRGFGQAELIDGFLWDIPMVGIFSPVLNSVLPGVGKSRIGDATATFTITNSIVHTDDLELRAPWFRLAYRGTSDFDGRIKARVEARLLRDAWVIGPLVSLVFSPLTKVLEYEVTGTLGQPRLELMYIPKPLQAPFNPLRTLREMFQDKPSQIPPPGP
jgi:hypothetical protein